MIQPPQTMESSATPMRPPWIVLGEDKLRRRKLALIGPNRPMLVVQIEQRIHRHEVHVRLPIGVERPDVAPVFDVLLIRVMKFEGDRLCGHQSCGE